MTLQLDIFGAGESDSLPPWLDPDRCARFSFDLETDRDHVGTEAIGRLGNNSRCWIVTANSHSGEKLKAWRFEPDEANKAYAFAREMEAKLQSGRQAVMSLGR